MRQHAHNTIVICSDEHHFRYAGYAGHPYVKTPNLDALAAAGTVFTRAYCNSPVCTPSRMSFITGKYVHQIGSWFIGVPLDEREKTWASRLSDANIRTTMLGKMDFCGPYQSGGFDDYRIIERRGMFKPYPRSAPLGSKVREYVREDKRRHLRRAGIRKPLFTNGSDGHNDALGFFDHDRMITEWAIEYLRGVKARPEGEPWTLYLGYLMPHWPYTCPEEYYRLYYPNHLTLPFDCVLPENPALHPALRAFQRACDLTEITQEEIRRTLAGYCGMITALDELLGRVFATLRELSLDDEINIVYTSDHGDSAGEHGLFFKQCSYDGSCAVPLIVKGPGIAKGHRVDAPVTLVDLYPTLMDLWGLPVETDRPGQSWRPFLEGASSYGLDYAFSEFHGNFFRKSWYMLVKDGFKYTYYVGDRPTLFNLENDPREMDDLAGQEKYHDTLAAFEKLLRTIVDPERVNKQANRDLGLIGPDGEDYAETLTFQELREGCQTGRFPRQPEFTPYNDYQDEH